MNKFVFIITILLLSVCCTSQKKLAYLNNLPETGVDQVFLMDIPEYKIQQRDILYITIKGMLPSGIVEDFLAGTSRSGGTSSLSEAGQYIFGFDVSNQGEILLPVLGTINVAGKTLEEARSIIQEIADKSFNNATVECKLLSFKFTVIGEVRSPGAYMNYNNYLTVLEAIGRAGGINDLGRRDKVLIVRSDAKGTMTYSLNLQDKAILASEAYFLLPNDVIIVEPESKKIFSLNLPTYSFILTSVTSAITTTLLLINFFK
ncbi:MAG TPA: polysaccharide biosynthesis/export family protein [Bacteroidales bacterium]|nr:polysaccharide biosynthesis/export family protein [Bacteroidales bacterium]